MSPYTRLEKYLIQALRDIASTEPAGETTEALADCIVVMRSSAAAAVKRAIHG